MKLQKLKVRRKRRGFSLLELLAVVTILGIIALVVIPRISVSSASAKAEADRQNKSEINAAVERYYFENDGFPSADLNEIDGHVDYFPDGIPSNPVTGDPYTLNAKHRAQ